MTIEKPDLNLQERSKDEWQTLLTAFNLAFSFLNHVFYRPPDVDLLNTLVAERMFYEWPLPASNEMTQQGLAFLQAFSSRWQPDQLPALQEDYARLFVGPGHLLAAPWESVYLSEEHLVFEQETLAVREFYRRFGVQVPRQNIEPDDHFALELAFLVHLNGLTQQALAADNLAGATALLLAQRDFLAEHLLLWAASFLQRVRDQATSLYFRGASCIAQGALELLASRLEVTVQPVLSDRAPERKQAALAGQRNGFSVREL